jgi:hypothetical protein
MLRYALILNPLLTKFDEALSSLRLNNEVKKVVVTVYANDWNITLTYPRDIPLLHILYTHEQTIDAKINESKGKDLLLGKWNTSIDVLGIPFITETRVLGILSPDYVNPNFIVPRELY